MLYAIALGFDEGSTEFIKRKIYGLVEHGINPYMVNNKIPPHLTISLFDTCNEAVALNTFKDISAYVPKTSMQICSIGMFEPRVIYYKPEKSDFLITLNQKVTNKLLESSITPDSYYLPDNWVPHVALGVKLTSEELIKALSIIKQDMVSFEVQIKKVVLAKCDPYMEISESIL